MRRMSLEHKTGVAIGLTIFIAVFGEAIGELIAQHLIEIGCVLIMTGVLIMWWSSYDD